MSFEKKETDTRGVGIDWHAIAKKDWAAARVSEVAGNLETATSHYRAAAAAWTWALAGVPVTLRPELEIERMLYLRNRSKTYMKMGQHALALDDIEWLLRLQGVWDGRNLTLTADSREAYFIKYVEAYVQQTLVRSGKDDVQTGIRGASWLESTAYLAKPDAFQVLFSRTIDDVEHFAIALERFGNDRAAALVYTLLSDADMRDGAEEKWERRLTQAGRRAVTTEQKRESEAKIRQSSSSLSTSHHTDDSEALEDVRTTWHDLNTVARQYAGGRGSNEVVHTENQRVGHFAHKQEMSDSGASESKTCVNHREPAVDGEKDSDEDTTSGVEVRWTAEYGRGLYATRALPKGGVVWMETPLVAASVDVEACATCARNVASGARAPHCCVRCGEATLYCSDECRKRDERVHAPLCGMDMRKWQAHVARHGTSLSSRNPLVFMRMLAQRVAKQKGLTCSSSSTTVSSSTTSSTTASSAIVASTTVSSSKPDMETTAYLFPPLYASNEAWMRESLQAVRTAPYAAGMSREQMYDLYSRNRRYFAGHALIHPQMYNLANFLVCTELLTVFGFSFDTAALNERKCGVGETEKLPATVASGSGLYPLAAQVNHSCEPNLLWTHPPESAAMPRNTIVFAATRDIAAGEQLFVTYINADAPYKERQLALAAHHFQCRCRKCSDKL